MALDEYLFGKAVRYFRNKKQAETARLERSVKLDDIRQRLTILARALTAAPIEIYPAEKEGGYRNENFFLPGSFALLPTADDNVSYYIFRVFYLSVQRRLNLNWSGTKEHAAEASIKAAVENAPRVLEEMYKEYPATEALHEKLATALNDAGALQNDQCTAWLYGKWMRNEIAAASTMKDDVSDKLKSAQKAQPKTILKAKAVESVTSLEVDKKQQEDYVLTHNFEKVETADEFNGVWRDFDGDDELEKHQDALEELSMKYTVRVDDTAHSVYQSDFLENITASECTDTAETACMLYDEWDYKKRNYKPGFCKLYPLVLKEKDAAYYESTVQSHATVLTGLRKMLSNLKNKRQQVRRQSQGNEFDMDAVTDLMVDIRTGNTPTDKIYLSTPKKETDLSVLLLIDSSLSSDGYADGNRIIDVEKQTAILFGEILNEYEVDFSINSFYSKTRNYSSYITLKGFDEKWSEGRQRIGAMEPTGYTRIGTAIRHSGELLSARSARNKWCILISDGKPNDFDTYEGKYGIHDVRQALRELHQKQINTYAFAIETAARYYLPQLFGTNHYQVLSSPNQLLTAMTGLYDKIKSRG